LRINQTRATSRLANSTQATRRRERISGRAPA
jgi:hypothetical protein